MTSSRWRGALVLGLGVVSIMLLTLSTIAVWARATIFDSAEAAAIVGDALDQPEVEAALAQYVTDQVFIAFDVEAAIANAIPDDLERLQALLAFGARPAVERTLTRAFAEPAVQNIIVELVERAHRRAMRVLEGGGLNLVSVDGEVAINLLPLVGRGLTRLQELGIGEDRDLPELTADGDPDEQIAQLEEALGRDLPENFGQLVVYSSESLAENAASLDAAQRIVAMSKKAVWVLVGLTLAGIAATVFIARRRWRVALWLGLGGVVAMVLIRTAVHRVVDDAPNLAARPGGRAAISAIVGGASTGLLRLAGFVLIVAAVAALAALLKRRWRRDDLVLAGAMLTFAAIVAVLGFSLGTLVVAVIVAALVPVAVHRLGLFAGVDRGSAVSET